MAFIRKVEDFVCEHCGAEVEGTGYTNHCPKCLWSKHVDNDPGDRAAACGGLMEPIAIEGSTPHYKILQKCLKCGKIGRITMTDEDNPDSIVALIKKNAK